MLAGILLIGSMYYYCSVIEIPMCSLNPFNPFGAVNSSSVVVLDDPSDCQEVAKVTHSESIWKRNDDGRTVFLEIGILKQIAYKRHDANAISNIIIYDKFEPIGEATAYKCPAYKIEVLKYRQTDQDFVKSFVKYEDARKEK